MTSSREQQRRVRDYRARKSVHQRRVRRLKRDNVLAVIAVVVIGGLAGFGQWFYVDQTTVRVPDPSLAEDREWDGEIVINGVDLEVELDGEAAPQAVSSFIYDTNRDYYTDTSCHRLTVSEGFQVLQCGSIDGQGSSDPEYSYGPIENAPDDQMYPAGTIAMARGGTASGMTAEEAADSNGHQFFIVYGDTTIPEDEAGGYTVIGQVTDGLDELIEDVTSVGIDPSAGEGAMDGPPAEAVTIESVTVE